MKKHKWEYVGQSPAHGLEYKKGRAFMIIYSNGDKRYWRDFPIDRMPVLTVYRSRKGREPWNENN